MAETGARSSIRNYRDLKVWQRAVDLVEHAYRLAAVLPHSEEYGLRAQIRRAAVSVPGNIAEGQGRQSRKDFVRFLRIARGSIMELETYVTITVRLGLVKRDEASTVWTISQEASKMLSGLISSLIGGASRGSK